MHSSSMARTCKACGALHLVIEHGAEAETTGHLECQMCGAELLRWNGAHTFTARLITAAGDRNNEM